MAELPDLGRHCSLQDCRQLDYLPICCQACGQVYCRRHASWTVHNCPAADFPARVEAEVEADADAATPASRIPREAVCPGCGPGGRLIAAPLECGACGALVCVRHRFPDQHPPCRAAVPGPPVEPPPPQEPPPTLDGDLLERLRRADARGSAAKQQRPRAPRQAVTPAAARLALMKLRLAAVGEESVPRADRVYLRILPHDIAHQSPELAIFFSRRLPLGKLIDSLAARLGVAPRRSGSVGAERLVIGLPPPDSDNCGSSSSSCPMVALPASDTLADCLTRGDLQDGGCLVLAFVAVGNG